MDETFKHNTIEAEKIYLGALLLAIAEGKNVEMHATKQDFLSLEYGTIYAEILQQLDDGKIPDILTLTLALSPHINASIIAELTNVVPSSANIELHEEKMLEKSMLWKAATEAQNIQEQLVSKDANISTISKSISSLTEIIASAEKKTVFYTPDMYFQEIGNYNSENEFRLDIIRGITFPDSSLSYIGSRPGGGKTIALINIAREALKPEGDKKRKVVLVNLEMPLKAITTYYILSCMYDMASGEEKLVLNGVENTKTTFYNLLKRDDATADKEFTDLQKNAIKKFKQECNSGHLIIVDGVQARTTSELIRYADKKITEGTVVLIDYVQRVPIANSNNSMRYLELKQVSNDILKLALRKKAVVISGAQLKREDKKAEWDVSLDSFRESGDIEQDAHNAIGIIPSPFETSKKCYAMKILKAREGMLSRKGVKTIEYTVLNSTLKYMHIAGTDISFSTPKKKGENEDKDNDSKKDMTTEENLEKIFDKYKKGKNK